MAKFVIEGTVSEIKLSKKQSEYLFKIKGIDGYAIKHGDKKYNILCEKSFRKSLSKASNESISSYILSQERQFKIDEKQGCLLTSALSNGKKLRIYVKESEINSNARPLSVSTLALLAE